MKYSSFLLLITFFLNVNLVSGRSYIEKYKDVLDYYLYQDVDSMKYKAAYFLITNMDGHFSPCGRDFDFFIKDIRNLTPVTNKRLSNLWEVYHKNNSFISMMEDSCIVTSEFLKENIDDAFSTWRSALWYKTISFDNFLRHILPYRAFDEYITGENWRRELRIEYGKYITCEDDLKTAFVKLRKAVQDNFSNSVVHIPLNMDVLSYNCIRRANCQQKCIFLTSVLRAFAIPAVVDNVSFWADYSTKGHSWVAMVMNDGETYTVYGEESEAKKYNRIDASEFIELEKKSLIQNFGIPIKYSKSVAKVYRREYEVVNKKSEFRNWFVDQFSLDVSDKYGLDGRIVIKKQKNSNIKQLYLCTYVSGKDWTVISRCDEEKDKFVFNNVGKNIVYLPAYIEENKLKPYSSPILLNSTNKKSYLESNGETCEMVTIKRKYPLCSYMPIQWLKLKKGIFEASNDSMFRETDTLFVVESVPKGNTVVNVESGKSYRYVRFKSPNNVIALFSEMSFYSNNEDRIYGRLIYKDVDKNTLKYLFDGVTETKLKAYKPGWWVGMDLGENRTISKIMFTPTSDGNDVQKGHLYELYCYDKGWQLIGRKVADSNAPLVYHNIPQNMLYLLKDKTKGVEERIFIIKNNEQIWY